MEQPVLLFDGVCNLCNYTVRFILKNEKNNRILFAPLQSAAALKLIKQYRIPLNQDTTGSVVFIEEGKVYLRSAAAFRIAGYMKNPYSIISRLNFIPAALTDFFYNLIAGSRYRVFGKRPDCMVPDKNIRSRFLE